MALTHRESRYVAARVQGQSRYKALLTAGFSSWIARVPQQFETPEIREVVELATKELVDRTIEEGLVDALELHQYVTDAIRADPADILNDDFTFKPMSEWPLIWRQLYEGGDLEIKFDSVRSHDGEDKDGAGGWDHKGKVISVKIKFAKRSEFLKLAAQLKSVDALVSQRGDTTINNLMVVTAEKAREVMAAKKRLQIAEARENAQVGPEGTEPSDDRAV
jgi:phage terminase small subunit